MSERDRDWGLAMTPTGSKIHVVDFNRRSALATNTYRASDHKSLCGEIPRRWDRIDEPIDSGGFCRRCSATYTGDVHDLLPDRNGSRAGTEGDR